MTRWIIGGLAVLLAVASLGVAVRAFAHAGAGRCGPMGFGPGPAGWHRADLTTVVEDKLGGLHDALGITAAQEAAWQAFAADTQERAARLRDVRPDPQSWARLTAPERLERIAAGMKAHQPDLEALSESLRALYGALTPEQQQVLDRQWQRRGLWGGRDRG